MLTSLLAAPPLVTAVQRWAVESQQRARRNAMIASTECAARRAEREDVDDYFAGLAAAALPAVEATPARRAR